jgi:hypothetical protein
MNACGLIQTQRLSAWSCPWLEFGLWRQIENAVGQLGQSTGPVRADLSCGAGKQITKGHDRLNQFNPQLGNLLFADDRAWFAGRRYPGPSLAGAPASF